MDFRSVSSVLGRLLMIYSLSLLPPILISLFVDNSHSEFTPFLITFLHSLTLGLILYFISRVKQKPNPPRIKEGFFIVVLYWFLIGVMGAMPFILSSQLSTTITLSDALFESFSGLTTTGATVINNIDALPDSLKYYRQQLQWIGGMGIVVLAVAVLPTLGVGGMQLYKAEIAGPFKTNKLAPRISTAARRLWYIYLLLTLLCFMAYWLSGMSAFDAIAHSFSTISIGGFSTYDASLGHFNNATIEIIAIIFMVLAGINFALHFSLFQRSSNPIKFRFTLSHYFHEIECRLYIVFLIMACTVTLIILHIENYYDSTEQWLRQGIFQAVSIATTTGFSTTEWSAWPIGLPLLLIFYSFIGGCSGSTAGGMKIIRFIMIFKQGAREVLYLIHPNMVRSLIINGTPVSERMISSVWGFFAIYLFTFCLLLILLSLTNIDAITAFSALAACINNLGPGLGDVSQHYQSLSETGKLILAFAMLVGRLEFYTLLVILSPAFWRT